MDTKQAVVAAFEKNPGSPVAVLEMACGTGGMLSTLYEYVTGLPMAELEAL